MTDTDDLDQSQSRSWYYYVLTMPAHGHIQRRVCGGTALRVLKNNSGSGLTESASARFLIALAPSLSLSRTKMEIIIADIFAVNKLSGNVIVMFLRQSCHVECL